VTRSGVLPLTYSQWTHIGGWVLLVVLAIPNAAVAPVALARMWRGESDGLIGGNRASRYGEAGERARDRSEPAVYALFVIGLPAFCAALINAPPQLTKHSPVGPGSPGFTAGLALVGACVLLALVLKLTISAFNRPRFLAPPHLREDPGLWRSERDRRSQANEPVSRPLRRPRQPPWR
jgi:hypothetical protein